MKRTQKALPFIAETFQVQIQLGNDAVRNGWDVARLLRALAYKVEGTALAQIDGGRLMDLNGNSVGTWEVK